MSRNNRSNLKKQYQDYLFDLVRRGVIYVYRTFLRLYAVVNAICLLVFYPFSGRLHFSIRKATLLVITLLLFLSAAFSSICLIPRIALYLYCVTVPYGGSLPVKQEHLSIGLKSIQSITEKHNGNTEFKPENHVFHSSVMLAYF